jgi:glycosyltransferase involved in cell wall biosynthesis
MNGTHESPRPVKVLQVAASDLTIAKMLLPLIDRLQADGYEVAAACGNGAFVRQLTERGYTVYPLPLTRTIHPWHLIRGVWAMYRFLRRHRFDVVHVHTPVAAAVGRVAAKLAGVPLVVYTAHGFYFHERTRPRLRKAMVAIERALGRGTDLLFTQSGEDAQTALEEGIGAPGRVVWIGNGVDVNRFHPRRDTDEAKRSFGLSREDAVVGFVGRLVREKGILDLLQAMNTVAAAVPNLVLLIAGDVNTAKDRDQKTYAEIRRRLEENTLPFRVVFTGFIDDIERMMAASDVFVLPSYREGMPRSVIEAMASGKPVVATRIRGCREEVVEGETGLLFPPGDVPALAAALTHILADPDLAQRMGQAGRVRAEELFDEQQVLDRQVIALRRLLSGQTAQSPVEVRS